MWGAVDVSGRLNTITELQDSIGLSLGTDNGFTGYDRCRMAVYEDNLTTHHHWYGTALYSNGSVAGLGLWGSSGFAVIDQGSTPTGTPPHLLIRNGGNVGLNKTNPGERLDVVGNIRCTGSLTASSLATNTKNFDIPNEGTGKENFRCRHWCVEGDTPGGSLMYKRQVTAPEAGLVDIVMPSYFAWLAKNIMIFSSGVKHNGTAWGEQDELDPCVLHLTVSRGGTYNVMIVADRNDTCATSCPQEVEYIAPIPVPPDQAFP